jgi:acid phosphatase (class A)
MAMKMHLSVGLLLGVAAIAVAKEPAPDVMKKAASSLGQGYLGANKLPDALAMIPPPPAPGSAAEARDKEGEKAALALHGTARWELATADAEIFNAEGISALSCAAGVAINAKATPALDKLLRRAAGDLGLSTGVVKRKYLRPRPFTTNGQPQCTPAWDAVLRKDGSYPSGHSAIGYGWGLILAELLPDRAAQLVARGRSFGDSRRICNVHYRSDVEEGWVAAAAVVARLHAEPAFLSDVKAAKKELAKAGPPTRDCAKEAAALVNS